MSFVNWNSFVRFNACGSRGVGVIYMMKITWICTNICIYELMYASMNTCMYACMYVCIVLRIVPGVDLVRCTEGSLIEAGFCHMMDSSFSFLYLRFTDAAVSLFTTLSPNDRCFIFVLLVLPLVFNCSLGLLCDFDIDLVNLRLLLLFPLLLYNVSASVCNKL